MIFLLAVWFRILKRIVAERGIGLCGAGNLREAIPAFTLGKNQSLRVDPSLRSG
jgi:hypothetical protein